MIITKTPFRISFFGGGTDYPIYYNEYGGSVLSTTINKYCYVTCRYLPPYFSHKYLIRYSKNEYPDEIDPIEHPSVRECLRFSGLTKGIEMVYAGDVPSMSGIGSSSSFTVGFLNAIYALQGKIVTKRKLALDAINVEQNLIKENVGSQDQIAASFGGFNRIDFGGNEEFFLHPITITEEKLKYLQSCLLFYFTGISRYSSDIAKEQIEQTKKRIRELNIMKEMVDEAINILNGRLNKLNDFGKLLNESWILKKSLTSKISNTTINDIYEKALNSGALGGKICGAGGGGFIVLFVPPEYQNNVIKGFKKLLRVPIRFENIGTHIVHFSQQ